MATESVMLDIETLSTRSDALVLSIGAVKFSFTEAGPLLGEELLVIPRMMEQLLGGRHVDQATQKWWASQPPEASDHWSGLTVDQTVAVALMHLQDFCAGAPAIWANGAVFDIGILESLCYEHKMTVPWRYNAIRDARTIYQVCPQVREAPFNGTALDDLIPHHPLHDCKIQIAKLWQHWPAQF